MGSCALPVSQLSNGILRTHGAAPKHIHTQAPQHMRDKGSQLKHPPKGMALQQMQPEMTTLVHADLSSSPHTHHRSYTTSRNLPRSSKARPKHPDAHADPSAATQQRAPSTSRHASHNRKHCAHPPPLAPEQTCTAGAAQPSRRRSASHNHDAHGMRKAA
jgi:hypothetical protein